MQKLTFSTMLRASEDCVAREISGEIVLLNLRNGIYFGLDETGAHIWALLANTIAFGALVQAIHDRTGASPPQIEADLRIFLDDLLDHDLADIDEAAAQ